MLRKLLLCAAVLTLLAACSQSETPVATDTVTETPSPSVSPSPEPAQRKVGDCVIEPGTDCRGDDLRGANLYSAKLQRSNLSQANLNASNLNSANLRKTDLNGATFRHADLRGAKLNDADLSEADLTQANLEGANLTGADTQGARLRGARICKTIWTNGVVRNTSCEPPASPSPSPSPSASPSSSFTGTARVTALSAPDTVSCDGRNNVNVDVDFGVARASLWKILVDRAPTGLEGTPQRSPWEGTRRVRLQCKDEASHRITVVASNASGSAQRTVTVSFSS